MKHKILVVSTLRALALGQRSRREKKGRKRAAKSTTPTMMSPAPNVPTMTSRGRRQKRGSGRRVQRQDSVTVWMERKMEVDGAWKSGERCKEGWRGGQREREREEERAVEVRMEEGEWKQVFGERGKMKKEYEARKEKQRERRMDTHLTTLAAALGSGLEEKDGVSAG
ncbi:hypothetical protein B0H17DRAFT_1138354 [Mycena rosella]|uniref:Uncharacterized protein n=1 Tax=Mycena rosella TaxID=1033263 RepID=A0AAD7D6K7_MYCRO|nr:hypothetical protein B0H17DRAFT_1138354 [Mycena rosella]